jgi:hypothetical protein
MNKTLQISRIAALFASIFGLESDRLTIINTLFHYYPGDYATLWKSTPVAVSSMHIWCICKVSAADIHKVHTPQKVAPEEIFVKHYIDIIAAEAKQQLVFARCAQVVQLGNKLDISVVGVDAREQVPIGKRVMRSEGTRKQHFEAWPSKYEATESLQRFVLLLVSVRAPMGTVRSLGAISLPINHQMTTASFRKQMHCLSSADNLTSGETLFQ